MEDIINEAWIILAQCSIYFKKKEMHYYSNVILTKWIETEVNLKFELATIITM